MVTLSWLTLTLLHCLLRVGSMQLLGTLSHSFGTTVQKCAAIELTCLFAAWWSQKTNYTCMYLPKHMCTAFLGRIKSDCKCMADSGREESRQDLLSAKLRASWAPPMSVKPHWDRPRLVKVLLPFKAWAMACAPATSSVSAQPISAPHSGAAVLLLQNRQGYISCALPTWLLLVHLTHKHSHAVQQDR